MSNVEKTELITAIQENQLVEFIVQKINKDARFSAYGYEITLLSDDVYRVISTTSHGWHHNDQCIGTGPVEYCAEIVSRLLHPKMEHVLD